MEKSLPPVVAVDPGPVILPSENSSSLTTLYADPEFGLDWDNDVAHNVSRNLLHLRRYRAMSQGAVAKVMGTSQSAIARIEAGEENITLDTLRRHVVALGGRFLVSILPKEFSFERPTPWWEARQGVTDVTSATWNCAFVAVNNTGDKALVGLEKDDPFLSVFAVGSTFRGQP